MNALVRKIAGLREKVSVLARKGEKEIERERGISNRSQLSTNTACACLQLYDARFIGMRSVLGERTVCCSKHAALGARRAAPCEQHSLCLRCASRVLCPRPEPRDEPCKTRQARNISRSRSMVRRRRRRRCQHTLMPHLYICIKHSQCPNAIRSIVINSHLTGQHAVQLICQSDHFGFRFCHGPANPLIVQICQNLTKIRLEL